MLSVFFGRRKTRNLTPTTTIFFLYPQLLGRCLLLLPFGLQAVFINNQSIKDSRHLTQEAFPFTEFCNSTISKLLSGVTFLLSDLNLPTNHIMRERRLLLSLLGSLSLVTSESLFRVRSLQNVNSADNVSERRRKIDEFDLTFDEEGEPIDLPTYKLQLFPIPSSLDSNSEMILETALQDYLTAFFLQQYPPATDDAEDTESAPPEFSSALVDIVDSKAVVSDDTRRRRLQREGMELDIDTTLWFVDGVFPEVSSLDTDMHEAFFNNFDVFLTEYLPAYAAGADTELDGIDSGVYLPGFTQPPTSSPSVGVQRDISEANEGIENNIGGEGSGAGYLLYTALGAGVAMFILTALVLSSKRRRVEADRKSGNNDDLSLGSRAHVSIDFDGRQEALELERERREEEYAQREIARRLKASKENRQSDFVSDGRRTLRFAKEDPPPSLLETAVSSGSWETNPQGEDDEDWKYLHNVRYSSALVDDVSSQGEI